MKRSVAVIPLARAAGRWLLFVVSVQAVIGLVVVLSVLAARGIWFHEELPVMVLFVLVVVLAFLVVDATGRVLREQERRSAASDSAGAEDTVARIRSVLDDMRWWALFRFLPRPGGHYRRAVRQRRA
jgi:heme A synthase